MAKQNTKKESPTKRGLVTDNSYLNQPVGALTFALNVVNESEVGDKGFRSNEQSNEPCYTLPEGYIPIGQIFVNKNQTLLFLSSKDEQSSEIGITDSNCVYTTLVRAKLGFKINNQISGTYRLRRGCERTFYFSTPVPMIFNMDKPEDFKTDGLWDIEKFKLFKVYEQIPNFETIEVLENGALTPGSYNATIQYLDEDLNPTEWITTCEPIKIYNDSSSKEYKLVRGSTSIADSITNFGPTNKSIKFTFSNFDDSYAFYRVAIIESNTGNGLVNAVNFPAPISSDIKTFTYSGNSSTITEGTEAEIIAFNSIIEQAEFVEQIENRLVLSKVKGSQINFCNLQKYASRIQANLSLRTIQLNQLSTSNPKTESVNFDGTGYMPGEIYSFGIVYIFADSSLSPVYHIPGRADTYSSLMSLDNKMQDIPYQDNSCQDYWGNDSEGIPLKSTPVRHHRFPSRAEISEPLYEQIKDSEPFILNYLFSDIQGTISGGTTISYKILYTVNGAPFVYENSFLSANYDPLIGINITVTSSRDEIIITDVEEDVDGGGFVSVGINTESVATGLTYNPTVAPQEIDNDVSFYTSKVMGITFSGIDVPSLDDTNGKKVVGYYIVRNERTEDEKTILDSGVVTPMLLEERGFVAHGHIFPTLSDKARIDKDLFALIHPEHRFNNREYKNLTEISQEGVYTIIKQSKSSVTTQDVGAGTSYNPDVHKKSSSDYDGFSLHTFTRDTEVAYFRNVDTLLNPFTMGELFYLNALNSKVVVDSDEMRQEVYNVSGDNKIGIIQMNEDIVDPTRVHDKLPYVILKRKLANPYGNFRVLQYYKENKNPIYFNTEEVDDNLNGSKAFITNGDSYITPMRYHSAMFNDFKLAKRSTKSGTWKIIAGALLVAVGVAAAIFTGGTSLTISATGAALIAGAGVAAVGFGISSISSGVEVNQVSKVYEEKYEAGLRDTIQDDDTTEVFASPEDDEMQWLGDVVTNLWFESSVNIGLRNGASIALTDFLNAPDVRDIEGIFDGNDFSPNPVNQLDSYLLEKLTVIDTENEDGRLYKGYPGAELYFFNKDYSRTNKQKIFYALGLEYDCCSDCSEDFPHRNHYSEQSFQEELTDNYRTFLPNNYRDIEGEKGVITDVFRIQNNLYIHTEGALWHLPQNIQERITGDVVSFIGTGEFFSIPPRKITDDDKESAGTIHNWARMKTANGTLFVSATEGKVFLFDGNSLNPISSQGNENWFKVNLPLIADTSFKNTAGVPYPLVNNPSNKYGTGFISAYDTHKERFILTKKDFIFSDRIIGGTDYNICVDDGDFIIFDGYQQTINDRNTNDWNFSGIEDCRMKFSKEVVTQEEQLRDVINTIPNEADVHIFYDTSGSFGGGPTTTVTEIKSGAAGECLQSISQAVTDWKSSLSMTNPDWTGTVYEYTDSTERWVNYAKVIESTTYLGQNIGTKDIIVISFCNESNSVYHGSTFQNTISDPTTAYLNDYNVFVTLHGQYKSFLGVHYPIVFGTDSSDCAGGSSSGISASKEFLSHSIASLEGESLTPIETGAILTPQNPGFNVVEWAALYTALQGVNNYPLGLKNYGWVGKWNRNSVFGQPIITSQQFNQDITDLIKSNITIEQETVLVNVINTIVEYEEGVIVDEPIEYDKSWTMSYSLEDKEWISWHSYIPNFYMYRLQEFYSWKHENDKLWKHNSDSGYQRFYGILYPHIIEYVDNKYPKETKLWDYVSLQTSAQEFNATYNEYVDKDITFNKVIAYTSKQTTGLLDIVVKNDEENYLDNQVSNSVTSILIDRNERDWSLNDLRDVVIDYNLPLFRKDFISLKSEYYIDKVLNNDALDYNKSWDELQSFRDKYLVLRLIFDNFDNIRLITNFTEEVSNKSSR